MLPEVLALYRKALWSDPLPLTDGRFLRLTMSLYREQGPEGVRLKVGTSGVQYQSDRDGAQWMFRYDYLRLPADPHPSAHLQIRGTLVESVGPLPRGQLDRAHFPTGRVSIEAVIRLLIEQFGVPPNKPKDVWRPVLAESEASFERVAHRPLSGPDR